AALRAKKGVATEADRALLGLADALDGVNAAADTSTIDAYTAALKKLGEAVPDLAAQIKLEDDRKAIDDAYNSGLAALNETYRQTDDLAGFTRDYNALVARRTAALESLARTEATSGGRSYIDKLIGVESGGNATATNSRSTATGLGQFTEGTWLDLFEKS